jgi:predicted kinase
VFEEVFKKTKTCVILIGLQASGKTTFYEQYLKDSCEHISLDILHTRNKERQAVEGCITRGVSFAVDNTNPTIAERQKYIQAAHAAGYQVIGCYLKSGISECALRNRAREDKAKVPDVAIYSTSNKLQLPSVSEGFDRLYYVSVSPGSMFDIEEQMDTP